MLHAFLRNKSGLHRRYLPAKQRDPGNGRVTQEDEVTSTVLGPLEFLHKSSTTLFWTELIRTYAPSFGLPDGDATDAVIRFWPTFGKLQPDLLVELKWGREVRLLLIEIKWLSNLSGDNQLEKQWLSCLSRQERAVALHLFIGIETAEGYKALAQKDVWGGRLVLLSWMQVLNTVFHIRNADSPQLHAWARHVLHFLRLVGIVPFKGFDELSAPEHPIGRGSIFWRGTHGFIGLLAPDVPERAQKPIFFHVSD